MSVALASEVLDPAVPAVIVEVTDLLGGPIVGAEVFRDDVGVGVTDARGIVRSPTLMIEQLDVTRGAGHQVVHLGHLPTSGGVTGVSSVWEASTSSAQTVNPVRRLSP